MVCGTRLTHSINIFCRQTKCNWAYVLIFNQQHVETQKEAIILRIGQHPILDFKRGAPVTFTFDGKAVSAFAGETIAVALHAAGFKTLSHSLEKHRPRGLYCAIGNCSSCMMVVDGESNVKACMELVREGMVVSTQRDKGVLI